MYKHYRVPYSEEDWQRVVKAARAKREEIVELDGPSRSAGERHVDNRRAWSALLASTSSSSDTQVLRATGLEPLVRLRGSTKVVKLLQHDALDSLEAEAIKDEAQQGGLPDARATFSGLARTWQEHCRKSFGMAAIEHVRPSSSAGRVLACRVGAGGADLLGV